MNQPGATQYERVARAYGIALLHFDSDFLRNETCTGAAWNANPGSAHPHIETHTHISDGVATWLRHVTAALTTPGTSKASHANLRAGMGAGTRADMRADMRAGMRAEQRADMRADMRAEQSQADATAALSTAPHVASPSPPPAVPPPLSCAHRPSVVADAVRARFDLVCVNALRRHDAGEQLRTQATSQANAAQANVAQSNTAQVDSSSDDSAVRAQGEVGRSADGASAAAAAAATAASGAGWRVVNGDWRLREDRAEKPGWISEGSVNGSTIEFDVAFGRSPRLTIVYDESWEGTPPLGRPNLRTSSLLHRGASHAHTIPKQRSAALRQSSVACHLTPHTTQSWIANLCGHTARCSCLAHILHRLWRSRRLYRQQVERAAGLYGVPQRYKPQILSIWMAHDYTQARRATY